MRCAPQRSSSSRLSGCAIALELSYLDAALVVNASHCRGPPLATIAIMYLLAALVTLCVGAVSASLLAQPAQQPVAGGSALSPGDVVRITVWRKPELSGEFVVNGDGSVSHPLYRDVRVAGIPLESVEARLREFLTKLEANPQFVVEPLLRVAVSGEVRQPNLYTLRPETSLAQAVAMAGGPTERGRRDRVRLTRQSQELLVDLRRGDASGAGMPVRSGDQILVEQHRAIFRDLVSPAVSFLGATAAVVSVILYNGRR
jgi:protein involved in polysaccharide export with SLBB domain